MFCKFYYKRKYIFIFIKEENILPITFKKREIFCYSNWQLEQFAIITKGEYFAIDNERKRLFSYFYYKWEYFVTHFYFIQ